MSTPPLEYRQQRAVHIVLGTNAAFVIVMVLLGYPYWWVNISFEQSPLTWFSSLQLLIIAALSFAVSRLANFVDTNQVRSQEQRFLWPALGYAFIFLAIDERFQIHERVRDGIFKPNNIGTDIPGIGAGDFLPIIYAIAGLLVATRLFLEFKNDRLSKTYFLLALFFALLATAIDVIDLHTMGDQVLRWQQFIEELAETLSQAFFLSTWLRHLLKLLSYVDISAKPFQEI